jgi:hypothetical protein
MKNYRNLDPLELLTVEDALFEVYDDWKVEDFKKLDEGRAFSKYKNFIHSRKRLDEISGILEMPLESKTDSSTGALMYSRWWLRKKVRDMNMKLWLEEFEYVPKVGEKLA